MARRSLSRWQKASALVPMAVLVAAWGAALTNSGLANASDSDADTAAVPAVPATAFEQPASVQKAPSGIDMRAGTSMAVSTLSPNGIPSAALYAYRRAENLLSRADESCNLPWNLVAAIGRVESNHGRTNNNTLTADGVASPGIYGIALDGTDGTARITDTDGGKLDKDTTFDRAVGPMQFIPGTWASAGVDADGDGAKNPQDIDDAATASGVYLCAGPGDLSKKADAATAVKRYNNSDSYVALVLQISEAYASGDFTQAPDSFSAAPVLTNRSVDQSLTQAQRQQSAKNEQKANTKPKPKPGTNGSTGGTGTTPTTGTGGSGGGGSTGGGGGSSPSTGGKDSTVGGVVDGIVGGTPLGGVTSGVTDVLTVAQARVECGLAYPADVGLLGLGGRSAAQRAKYGKCVYDRTH